LWYRGFHQNNIGAFGPESSAEIKTSSGEDMQVGFYDDDSIQGIPNDLRATPAAHSGNWPGQKGIYQNSWSGISDLLNDNKSVTRSFKLPLTEIVRFSFANKIRVENMDYLVRNLSVTLSNSGLKTTKADLLAVV